MLKEFYVCQYVSPFLNILDHRVACQYVPRRWIITTYNNLAGHSVHKLLNAEVTSRR